MFTNALTGNAYSARNCDILNNAAVLLGTECTRVAGFKQWLELGRVVAKGQHGTKIYMVCSKKDDQPDDGSEPTKRKVMKLRTVFFESQTVELQSEAA